MSKCSHCSAKPVYARQLCSPCYQRWQRKGALDYVSYPTKCRIEGCDGRVVSNGYCDKHRKRMSRHGSPVATRPHTWGKKSKHPLYGRWKESGKGIPGRHSVWSDFWQFVSDVGEKPSPRSVLKRPDISKSIGPDNFFWSEPVADRSLSKITKAEYQRQWRKKNPRASKNTYLKKTFGITIDQYEAMLESQNNLCAICSGSDEHFSLAVDHDHKSGKVRGLLCSQCNRGLGLFKDEVVRLESALKYLKARH